jgi:hypothetical protein
MRFNFARLSSAFIVSFIIFILYFIFIYRFTHFPSSNVIKQLSKITAKARPNAKSSEGRELVYLTA